MKKDVLVAFDWFDVNGVCALRSVVSLQDFGEAICGFIDTVPVRVWNLLREGEIHIDYVQRIEDNVAISTDRNPDFYIHCVSLADLSDVASDLDMLLRASLNEIFLTEFVEELYNYASCNDAGVDPSDD